MGLNQNHVFPVRNYSIETECDLHMDILNLRAQLQILRNSKTHLRDKFKLEESKRRNKSARERDNSREREDLEEIRRNKLQSQHSIGSISGAIIDISLTFFLL